ncbi:E3 ubiquitin-protein ligase MARCH2-like [Cimex lectularius]|uniref:RING-CH-type domain-containing protein n=1 Tax=Cimex lectularius TaxID=79782 RepID=A0A8I6RKA6_CIMLE|nr:E3 ubiquitin-protein ligase MARCH2-like [Cimex lectularius]XP_014247962.1 E3 ubiquitin-protein ligase MARCH2-like [Cimex lectularius]
MAQDAGIARSQGLRDEGFGDPSSGELDVQVEDFGEDDTISQKSFYSCKFDNKSCQTFTDCKKVVPSMLTHSDEIFPMYSAWECKTDLRLFPSECCRICHEQEDVESFISPCYCRGTMLRVHKSCLEAWLAESDSRHCELCGFVFNCVRIPKYNLVESLVAWFSNSECDRERKLLLCDVFVMAGLSPVIVIFTFVALKLVGSDIALANQEDENGEEHMESHMTLFALTIMLQSALLGILFLVDLSFVSWLLMRCDLHLKNWYKWYRKKSTVILLDLQGPNANRNST